VAATQRLVRGRRYWRVAPAWGESSVWARRFLFGSWLQPWNVSPSSSRHETKDARRTDMSRMVHLAAGAGGRQQRDRFRTLNLGKRSPRKFAQITFPFLPTNCRPPRPFALANRNYRRPNPLAAYVRPAAIERFRGHPDRSNSNPSVQRVS